jgi:hypothetical protein
LRKRQRVRRWRQLKSGVNDGQASNRPLERPSAKKITPLYNKAEWQGHRTTASTRNVCGAIVPDVPL